MTDVSGVTRARSESELSSYADAAAAADSDSRPLVPPSADDDAAGRDTP